MGKQLKIKSIDENGKEVLFRDVMTAAEAIDSKMEVWKKALLIADAINNKKRAFKRQWFKNF